MRAGELRELVTIQHKGTPVRDAAGGETITWTTFATRSAAVDPINGREYVALRAAQSDISIRFRLRYLTGVDTSMRVLWKGVAYEIVESINVEARSVETQLLCRGDANG